MSIEISNQIRIQSEPDFWYTVEDINVAVGCDGCTISYWEWVDNCNKRITTITTTKEEAIIIADQIYKLFGVEK